jgi:hypothetical protein
LQSRWCAGLQTHAGLQRPGCACRTLDVSLLLRLQQALVVLAGKLGIDRQPKRLTLLAAAGQSDGKVHHMPAARYGADLGLVLIDGKDLLEQTGQLGLAKYATRLDVAQQVLEVTHALGQALHFAQPPVHLLKPLGHMGKTRVQPLLQRAVELFIDRGTHLLELFLVAVLQRPQALFNRGADLGQALLLLRGQLLQLGLHVLGETAQGLVLHVTRLGQGLHQLPAGAARLRALLPAPILQALNQLLLHGGQLNPKRVDLLVLGAGDIAGLGH